MQLSSVDLGQCWCRKDRSVKCPTPQLIPATKRAANRNPTDLECKNQRRDNPCISDALLQRVLLAKCLESNGCRDIAKKCPKGEAPIMAPTCQDGEADRCHFRPSANPRAGNVRATSEKVPAASSCCMHEDANHALSCLAHRFRTPDPSVRAGRLTQRNPKATTAMEMSDATGALTVSSCRRAPR